MCDIRKTTAAITTLWLNVVNSYEHPLLFLKF